MSEPISVCIFEAATDERNTRESRKGNLKLSKKLVLTRLQGPHLEKLWVLPTLS